MNAAVGTLSALLGVVVAIGGAGLVTCAAVAFRNARRGRREFERMRENMR